METILCWKFLRSRPEFKSYYVVWKQEYGNLEETICDEFKSYYVVWKQKNNNINKTTMKFKSYYVVWKPPNLARTPRVYFCLNRTMQYGNAYAHVQRMNNHQSLNRTMQYGNIFSISRFPNTKMFKSYYVVWKPFHNDNAKEDIEV